MSLKWKVCVLPSRHFRGCAPSAGPARPRSLGMSQDGRLSVNKTQQDTSPPSSGGASASRGIRPVGSFSPLVHKQRQHHRGALPRIGAEMRQQAEAGPLGASPQRGVAGDCRGTCPSAPHMDGPSRSLDHRQRHVRGQCSALSEGGGHRAVRRVWTHPRRV